MARSEAQKAADKRYAEKVRAEKRYEQFVVNLKKDEYERICAAIESSGMSKADFIRWAVAQLKK